MQGLFKKILINKPNKLSENPEIEFLKDINILKISQIYYKIKNLALLVLFFGKPKKTTSIIT